MTEPTSASSASAQPPRELLTDTVGHDSHRATLKQDLHTAAKELLPDESRLQACFAARIDAGRTVGLEYSPDAERARVVNVCRCGNPHICPNCGPIESERKNRELRLNLSAWELGGFTVVSATFTIQHFRPESLEDTDTRLNKAYSRMWDRRDGREFKAEWSVFGRQRSPDVTRTEANGWHPHLHTLLYLERPALSQDELERFTVDLSMLWQKSAEAAGGYADLDIGCRVKADNIFEVADYITSKTSGNVEDWLAEQHAARARARLNGDDWGATEELTKSHLKQSRLNGLSPNEMLLNYLWGDEQAGKLWQEYASVFKGKKFVDSTPGLKKRLEALKEQFSEELAALSEDTETPEYYGVAHLSGKAFKQVVRFQIIQWLLEVVKESQGNPLAIRQFLADFEIYEVYLPEIDQGLPDWWYIPDPEAHPEAVEQVKAANEYFKQFNAGDF